MQDWRPDARYSWGGYPLGPVVGGVPGALADRQFLWNSGQRAELTEEALPNNPPIFVGGPGQRLQLPADCSFRDKECHVPPLQTCRSPK
jgi:hypothetical protein